MLPHRKINTRPCFCRKDRAEVEAVENGFPDKGGVRGSWPSQAEGGPSRSAQRQPVSVAVPFSLEQPHRAVRVNLAGSLSNRTLLSRSFCNSLISFNTLFSA